MREIMERQTSEYWPSEFYLERFPADAAGGQKQGAAVDTNRHCQSLEELPSRCWTALASIPAEQMHSKQGSAPGTRAFVPRRIVRGATGEAEARIPRPSAWRAIQYEAQTWLCQFTVTPDHSTNSLLCMSAQATSVSFGKRQSMARDNCCG